MTEHWSRALVGTWNTLGVVLLANILVIAMLSSPTRFRRFMNEPSNVWVTHASWVWLPTVMVFAAVFGHVLVYRRLVGHGRSVAPASPICARGDLSSSLRRTTDRRYHRG